MTSPTTVEVLKKARAPRVVDNDRDEITVTLDGKEIRGWSYETDAERRVKMRMAREFCEGWYSALAVTDPIDLHDLHVEALKRQHKVGKVTSAVDGYRLSTSWTEQHTVHSGRADAEARHAG